jgi:chaperonin cofactor prefoldin
MTSKKEKEDKLKEAQKRADELRGLAMDNIDVALKRGEQLEDLQNKAEILESQSKTFQKGATELKRKMCCENYRNTIIIIAIIAVIAVIIGLIAGLV